MHHPSNDTFTENIVLPSPHSLTLEKSVLNVRRTCIVAITTALFACSKANDGENAGDPPWTGGDDTSDPVQEPTDVSSTLEPIRSEYGLPALAAVRLADGIVTHQGVTGVRKSDDDVRATVDDKWHLGSCTKAMTSTLVAIHVDAGLLDWTTTMEAIFPDIDDMHEDFRDVTMEMLLSHTGGIDDADANNAAVQTFVPGVDDTRWRSAITKRILQNPRSADVGVLNYSNFGYVIAGAVLEHLTATTWEDLMRASLFDPLEMSGCGFGPPATSDASQPWGHDASGEPTFLDNPSVLGPAGTVHCPLAAWGRFISDQLRAYNGEASILSAEQASQMFTVHDDNYAMGWIVVDRSANDGGPFFGHTGSNTYSFADVFVLPADNQAFLVTTNRAQRTDYAAVQATTAALIALDEG